MDDRHAIAYQNKLSQSKRAFFRQLLVNHVVEFATRAMAETIHHIFRWESVLFLVGAQALLPNHGLYLHMATRAFPLVFAQRNHSIIPVLRAFYLWVSGYGSGSKAVFTLILYGNPVLAITLTCAICYQVIQRIQQSSSGSILSFAFGVLLQLSIGFFAQPIANAIIGCGRIIASYELQSPAFIFPGTEVALISILALLELAGFSNRSILSQFRLLTTRHNRNLVLRTRPTTKPNHLPTYTYTPLNPLKPQQFDATSDKRGWNIRLLEVISEKQGVVRFSFKRVWLAKTERPPKYVALSYVWGRDDDSTGIEIDGQWLKVSTRVYEMLFARAPTWAIVAADEPHYVWIDSVCINQDDVHEKNIQVSMMDMIYSKAASVVAFLRPEDDNESDIATHFLESLGRDHRQQRRRTYGITPWLLGTYHSVFDGLMDSSKGPSPGWNALTKLIGNKFWSRVWIVQELVLAPIDLRIFYGDHELCWINFCLFCQRIPSTTYIDFTYALQVFGENIMGTRLRVCETLRLRNKRMDGASLALTDLLLAVRNMGSTNPLDRVYAFVGIAPALASHITIEYSKRNEDPRPNIERLYTEVAAYLLREDPEWLLTMAGSGYSILEEVNVGKKNVEEENVDPLRHSYSGIRLNLPSWVPDLQSPSPTPLPNMRDRSAIEIQQTTIRMRNSTNILKTQNWIEITTVDIDYLTNEATDDLFPINRTPLGKHDDIFGYMNRMVRLWELRKRSPIRKRIGPEKQFCEAFMKPSQLGQGITLRASNDSCRS